MKKHPELTEAANFQHKKSFVAWRLHPGTTHHCQYLRGKDVEPVRRIVFEREGGRCCTCGAYYGWNYGEMDHIRPGNGLDRCWCEENLQWLCPRCHRAKHKQPQMRGNLANEAHVPQ